jgi:hypothetical protein
MPPPSWPLKPLAVRRPRKNPFCAATPRQESSYKQATRYKRGGTLWVAFELSWIQVEISIQLGRHHAVDFIALQFMLP